MAKSAGCCGALRLHLGDEAAALDDARRNIDAWWPAIEAGAEALVMNASGCGATVREYAHLLRHDPAYADKAKRVTALTRDVSEILAQEQDRLLARLDRASPGPELTMVAYHPPCTLQHGQQIRGFADQQLRKPDDPSNASNRRISVIVQYLKPAEGKAPANGKKEVARAEKNLT